MSSGLDVLGADGLGSKVIRIRIKSVDVEKLRQKVGGAAGAALPAALALVDQMPEVALNAALPTVARRAHEDYGVDLEYEVLDAPAAAARPAARKSSGGTLATAAAVALLMAGAGAAAWRLAAK